MIIAKCPLRVSLAGGSTDLEEFVDTYGKGAVISFPCNLYTYITLFSDKNGFNSVNKNYIINYTTREEVASVDDIKNDLAREALKYFDVPPVSISFNTDVFSMGSGLASSSSYLVALVKAISSFNNNQGIAIRVCSEALEIERKFNPLTGYQDPFGCGMAFFKKMEFKKGGKILTKNYKSLLFDNYDCYLIYTGVNRSSTDVLKTLDLKKANESLPLVHELDNSITREDYETIFKIMKECWAIKKQTSSKILDNPQLQDLDETLERDDRVKTHKLCGAGAGGYFLAFTEKEVDISDIIKNFNKISFKVKPDNSGVQVANVGKAASFM